MSQPLFDTKLWVSNLDRLLLKMMGEYKRSTESQTPLNNLSLD